MLRSFQIGGGRSWADTYTPPNQRERDGTEINTHIHTNRGREIEVRGERQRKQRRGIRVVHQKIKNTDDKVARVFLRLRAMTGRRRQSGRCEERDIFKSYPMHTNHQHKHVYCAPTNNKDLDIANMLSSPTADRNKYTHVSCLVNKRRPELHEDVGVEPGQAQQLHHEAEAWLRDILFYRPLQRAERLGPKSLPTRCRGGHQQRIQIFFMRKIKEWC